MKIISVLTMIIVIINIIGIFIGFLNAKPFNKRLLRNLFYMIGSVSVWGITKLLPSPLSEMRVCYILGIIMQTVFGLATIFHLIELLTIIED